MERNIRIQDKITEDNYKVFALISKYLNHAPDFIEKEEMEGIINVVCLMNMLFQIILC